VSSAADFCHAAGVAIMFDVGNCAAPTALEAVLINAAITAY
jgi:hypothetical protein